MNNINDPNARKPGLGLAYFHSIHPLTNEQRRLMRNIGKLMEGEIYPLLLAETDALIKKMNPRDLDFVDEFGETPLTKALSGLSGTPLDRYLLRVLKAIVDAGADLHKRGAEGWSALDLAQGLVEEGHPCSDKLKEIFSLS